jgi:shikimate dehydrogenase
MHVDKLFGLIGYPLKNTFSADFFNAKFKALNLPYQYKNFPIEDVLFLKTLLQQNTNLVGLNVTMPHKTSVMALIDFISSEAAEVNAVNCISIKEGKTTGYNTDVIGFEKSFFNWFEPKKYDTNKALILGNGGASKAVQHVLKKQGIAYQVVSRKNGDIVYQDLSENKIAEYNIIINCTTIGMHPNIKDYLNIPFNGITHKHYCYDLIYLPEETFFLKQAKARGAHTKNGLEMLYMQAEAAWQIWQKN